MSDKLFDLTGKVAIITGCSRGLGQSYAYALAKAGADLVITSRNLDSLLEFKAELEPLGRRVLPLELDVRSYESIQKMVEDAYAEYGRIDILVNNAGCNVRKPAVEMGWDDWDLVVDTNLKGSFFVAQAVAKKMIPQKWGRIINVGSLTTVFGSSGIAPYCASRGGIKQMTMSLADDWGVHGITVNCLAPGWFNTAQTRVLCENKDWVDYIVDRTPLKRLGEPEDLEGMVVFLASDASKFVTGQTLLVDGGMSTGSMKATVVKK